MRKRILGDMKNNPKPCRLMNIIGFLIWSAVILAAIWSAASGNWDHFFSFALVMVLLLIPGFLARKLKIELPEPLKIVIMLIIFTSQILGELADFYTRFVFWDVMMHWTSGLICSALGFALFDLLNRNATVKYRLNPLFLAVVAFCFTITVGVFWEYVEYGSDVFLKKDTQKDTVVYSINSTKLDPDGKTVVHLKDIRQVSVNGADLGLGGYLDIGLHDTMKDLLVNFVGAVVFSVIGYFSVKKPKKGKFAAWFIPRVMDEGRPEPDRGKRKT